MQELDGVFLTKAELERLKLELDQVQLLATSIRYLAPCECVGDVHLENCISDRATNIISNLKYFKADLGI